MADPELPDFSQIFGGGTDIGDVASNAGDMYSGGGYFGSGNQSLNIPGTQGGSWLDTLSGYANKALPFLKLGATGLGAFSGIEGMINAGQQRGFLNTAQKNLQTAAAPGLAGAQQLIPAGTQALMGGALPPGLEAQVSTWANSAKAQARQYYSHAGIQDSTMMAQMDAYIDQLAMQMRSQFAQGMIQSGQGLGGQSVQAALGGGQLAAREGDTTGQAIQQANQALFRVLGMA